MGVLRTSDAERAVSGAIVLDLGDLRRQGDELLARARREAARIVDDARAERERLLAGAREEGRAAGRAEGRSAGLDEGRAQGRAEAAAAHGATLKVIEDTWRASLQAFAGERERMLQEAQTDVLRLALRLGEKVTRVTLAARPEACVAQVRDVLALIARPTRLEVRVHPDDEPLVREALPALAGALGAGAHAELLTDATIARGGCLVRTPGGGGIDATIETQLDRIARALLAEDAP